MAIFLLIRHGENDFVKEGRMAGRLPDIHLNETGRRQVEILADRLANSPIRAVYSSPLERALQTAEPIAQRIGLEVITRTGLLEVDIGEWQGERIKSLSRKRIWRAVQTTPSRVRFPGGETFFEAQVRICQELEALVGLHDEKDLLVCVSHSDPIKLAVAHHLGMALDLVQRIHVSPASVTALQITNRGSRLLALNQDFSFSLPKN